MCPFIDVIDYETFAYCAQDEGARGAFDWEFFYKRLPLLPEDLRSPAKPFKYVKYSHLKRELTILQLIEITILQEPCYGWRIVRYFEEIFLGARRI